MKKGKLLKLGNSWKIESPGFKQPMSVAGDFGLTDDMAGQEIEFDNSGGSLKTIRFKDRSYFKKSNSRHQQHRENENKDYQMKDNATDISVGKAHAPYNFVPVNDKVVKSSLKISDIEFNKYNEEMFTGSISLDIKSLTPLYIRGLKPVDDNSDAKYAGFFSGKKYGIPGSSLRGLIRSMIEIVSYSKMGSINKSTKEKRYHYRAFADKSLSLREAYASKMIYKNKNPKYYSPCVKAGVLLKKGMDYFICEGSHFKVEEEKAKKYGIISQSMSIQNGTKFRPNPKYKDEFKKVYYKADAEKVHHKHSQKLKYAEIISISLKPLKEHEQGYIICSGWMIGSHKSPKGKHMHWVIGDINYNKELKVNKDVIENYINDTNRNGMDLIAKLKTGLKEAPCFFITNQDDQVASFGATGMFRLAYDKTLIEFFPDDHKKMDEPDFAETLFGKNSLIPGRVFVEDCYLEGDDKISKQVKIPAILSSPKPTTFQHYLKQQESDIIPVLNKQDKLSGFKGIKDYNQNTEINGFKLYWHLKKIDYPDNIEIKSGSFQKFIEKKKVKDLFLGYDFGKKKVKFNISKLSPEQLNIVAAYNLTQPDAQHTAIVPVLEDAEFKGDIRFENLSREELGALLFVLDLDDELCLKIGLGKPLGFGSIKIKPTVYISNRKNRYSNLLYEWEDDDGRPTLPRQGIAELKNAFETHILSEINSKSKRLWDEKRMTELRTMLDIKNSLEGKKAEYMLIDIPGVPRAEKNEFSQRPILVPPTEYIKKP